MPRVINNMSRIRTFDTIAQEGLSVFGENYQLSARLKDYDAIILRSASLHKIAFPSELKAIARAGVGVNNIPLEHCNEKGIIVINTPGGNANSVKELAILSLLLSSRKIFEGILWTQSLSGRGEEVITEVEKQKKHFVGQEMGGKTLGVIGLGAVGVLVANAAIDLGMKVVGYDPYLSIESAWKLSQQVIRDKQLKNIFTHADYLSIHVPLTPQTTKFLDEAAFNQMKPGMRIVNLARSEIIDTEALLRALQKKIVNYYITDFPQDQLLGREGVLVVPHLGASTVEAEINCAIMAATYLKEFLETGNVRHSVNFPSCILETTGTPRLIIANKNIPSMVGKITSLLAQKRINIANMLNRHRGDIAYNIIDLDSPISSEMLQELSSTPGILFARILHTD